MDHNEDIEAQKLTQLNGADSIPTTTASDRSRGSLQTETLSP